MSGSMPIATCVAVGNSEARAVRSVRSKPTAPRVVLPGLSVQGVVAIAEGTPVARYGNAVAMRAARTQNRSAG